MVRNVIVSEFLGLGDILNEYRMCLLRDFRDLRRGARCCVQCEMVKLEIVAQIVNGGECQGQIMCIAVPNEQNLFSDFFLHVYKAHDTNPTLHQFKKCNYAQIK
jgi:hypothetical protein